MLKISRIKETGAAYRTPTSFFEAYARKRVLGLSRRLDHVVLIEHNKKANRVTFVTTSGGRWPYDDEFHAAQEAFEVTVVGVRDESLEELADLAVAAALEWEHGVVLDDTVPHDFDLVGQLWSALMPLLKKEHPEHAQRLEKRIMNVRFKSLCFAARHDKEPCEARPPYMEIKIGECVISFNRYADEDQILQALRGAEAYMQETA